MPVFGIKREIMHNYVWIHVSFKTQQTRHHWQYTHWPGKEHSNSEYRCLGYENNGLWHDMTWDRDQQKRKHLYPHFKNSRGKGQQWWWTSYSSMSDKYTSNSPNQKHLIQHRTIRTWCRHAPETTNTEMRQRNIRTTYEGPQRKGPTAEVHLVNANNQSSSLHVYGIKCLFFMFKISVSIVFLELQLNMIL